MNTIVVTQNESQKFEKIESQVKWYNPEKGYGFLLSSDGESDIFMHFSVLDAAGCRRVEEGDTIVCEVGPGPKGLQVMKVLEVKFTHREPRAMAMFFGAKHPPMDLDALEEVDGYIKWFNPLKGFGFICEEKTGKEIFLHASILRMLGLESIEPGIYVRAKVSISERGREARTLQIL